MVNKQIYFLINIERNWFSMDIVITILYAFILMSAVLYVWHKLLGRKIKFKDYRLYITLIGMMFTSIANFTIILIFFFRYLFKEKLNKVIITPIFTQIIIFISEFLYAIILLLLFGNRADQAINSIYGTFVTNFIVAILVLISEKLKIVKDLYNKLLKATDKINSIQLCMFSIMGILILNVLLSSSFNEVKVQYLFIFNVTITILVLSIIFYSFRTQNKYNKV